MQTDETIPGEVVAQHGPIVVKRGGYPREHRVTAGTQICVIDRRDGGNGIIFQPDVGDRPMAHKTQMAEERAKGYAEGYADALKERR